MSAKRRWVNVTRAAPFCRGCREGSDRERRNGRGDEAEVASFAVPVEAEEPECGDVGPLGVADAEAERSAVLDDPVAEEFFLLVGRGGIGAELVGHDS